jgi:hypothetical protein
VALDAISATLPSGPGQRNRRIFDLARKLKGIPGLDQTTLKTIVSEWHRQALPVIRTKDFDETWSDFQIAWSCVKNPHGTTVHAALNAARLLPDPPIDDKPDLGVLAALCRNLSAGRSDRTFYQSCLTVKESFEVSRMTAWRWLQALQFYGFIEPVSIGTLKDRQATVWRYNV